MIVTIGHIKGGTGKTTTAFQVAMQRIITHPERKVWLIDTDEQQSCIDTVSVRGDLGLRPTIACSAYYNKTTLMSQLNAQADVWDDIIIDCGGRETDGLSLATFSSEKLIIPILPRAYDVWSLTRLETLVKKVHEMGSEVKPYAFINRKDKSAETKQAIAFVQASETITLMTASLSERMAYAKACGAGKAVSEMRPADKVAMREIEDLTKEIFGD